MAGSGSSSDGSKVDVEEVALRITLCRSLQDQGGPGGSGSSSSGPVARRRSAGDVSGPFREARSSGRSRSGRSAPGQVRLPPPPPCAPEAVPDHRWVLMPASGTGRTRMPESEARAARRERHRARERGEALAARCLTSSAPVDSEDALLAGDLRRSLTTAETDARRLRCKNVDALRLANQLLEREAAKEVAAKAKAARHVKEQDRLLRRLSGMRCSSDEDDSDASTSGSDDDDDDAPPQADAYTEEGHNHVDNRKGKGRQVSTVGPAPRHNPSWFAKATSSSWNSASWSPDDLDEPSRDGGSDLVSAPHERVTSRLRNRGTLEKICKKYSIPDSFTPIVAGDLSMWSPPPPDSVCVYVESLDVGMRLPLHPFFVTVLNHSGLAPSQLAPNDWRALAGFVVLSRFAGVEPSLAVFRHFFGMCVSHRFYCIRGKETAGLLFARINSKIRGWKEEFFFLESSAPWPCPVEWGEPSRSSTMEPALTVEEKAVAETLLCARGSSLIDLTTYLSNDNLAAAKIIGAPSPPPTLQHGPVNVAMGGIQAEKTATAAAARAWAGKVSVKSEPDCEVPPPCAPSLGKKRKLEEDRGVDGWSSALDLSCPLGFPAPWKPPPVTSKDGDWKAARRLLQGTVTPSRERELAASKPADVVASSYISLLQAANEVAFSLGHALELEERLMAREQEADALREELGRKTKALERDGAVVDALRTELRKAKAKLAETKADAERAERRGYERGVEDMKRAALRRYPKLDPARLVVPIQGPP